ncbi:hypothetical protein [Xenorhabdus budapestensis]|uniref:Structural protein n=1 Tax=Xenorhabdus budapestensis TaxID=290110 RepID=A0A2D0IMA5_XENBU|nr:hypothetical protein [Xenorhabdus budapestensis]PHM22919.1 structural protein [Xenorhabdus budapestensis]QTL38806.1 hypothetical protein HGO23_13075 [Xenorhabdus budapestensis]
MGNAFDFELHADDNATKALAEIEARIKQLNPLLDSTREALRFGGNETQENVGGLSNQLRDMSKFAKDNVQHIGAIIPPLKNVGELTAKYGSLAKKYGGIVGGVGAIGYGIAKMGQKLNEQSKEAYDLDVMAKNNNMTVEEFSRLSGAMVILGTDADKAKESVDGLYKIFNDPLQARNSATLAQLNSMGVSIVRKEDGTADISKTMEELAKVFPTYSSAKQKTIADFLGLDANTLSLLREGAKYKQLLAKSDKLGLTVPNGLNQQLTDLNGTINELNASWEGLKQRVSNATTNFLTSDGSVDDGLKGVSDILTYGPDNFAIMRTLGATRGNESDQLRWGYNTPEFYKTLSTYEKTMLDFGLMTDGYRKKYQKWHEKKGTEKTKPPIVPENQKHYQDIYQIPNDPNRVKNSGTPPRGIRNNNPGNLIAAPNTTGEDFGNNHKYVKFGTAHDGLSAMARQIMLDAERGRNDITSLLYKYAGPEGGNDTPAYIEWVSKGTGYGRNQPLDMYNPEILKNVMKKMIEFENASNPYSDEQIKAAINDAIHSDRWKGKRNPQILREQRLQYGSGEQEQQFPSLYSKKKDVESEAEIAKGMAKAFQEAMGDKPFQVEIVLVNDKTGERQKFQSNSAGKVTTSMQYP